jgi:two-component system sensor histidine kinase KdpD
LSRAAALAAGVLALVIVTTLYALLGVTNQTIVALSFLLVVLITATVSTRGIAIAISLSAFLAFNYFFLPPVGTLAITDPENWVALFTLLAVSIVASQLSTQARRRAMEATARRDELSRLFDLTRDILLTTDSGEAVVAVARFVASRFGLRTATICLPGPQGWQLHPSSRSATAIDTRALDNALTAARTDEIEGGKRIYAGHTTIDFPDRTRVWLVPLRVGARPIGLLALEGEEMEPGTRDAIAGVTAIAIERSHLLDERKESELVRRGAELKSALLASLGHDLRTPLTAVTVAANNLDASWLTDDQRKEQAQLVRSELGRLGRLFQDIEDMARIETKAVAAESEWVDPAEIVEAALKQAGPSLADRTLQIEVDANRSLAKLDPRLTSAALAHLLENAGQYSPPRSIVSISVTLNDGVLSIAVRDQGPGIRTEDREQIFERLYRGIDARQQRFGTGMGLAITRGLLAAEGGRVAIENHPSGGAVFTITIPVETRMSPAIEEEHR